MPNTVKRNQPVLGTNLHATMIAVWNIVQAWHSGRLVSPVLPPKTPKSQMRYTPSFSADKGPTDFRSVPYTAKAICDVLGTHNKACAHPVVLLALLLHELKEKDLVSTESLNTLFFGGSFSVKDLSLEARTILSNRKGSARNNLVEAEEILAQA